MRNYRDTVKDWLKAIGKDRIWLATECGVSPRTSENWFSANGTFPVKVQKVIDSLMISNPVDSNADAEQNLVLHVGYEKFDAYNRAAMKNGMLIREWIIYAADQAAAEAAEKAVTAPAETDEEIEARQIAALEEMQRLHPPRRQQRPAPPQKDDNQQQVI